MTKENHTCNNVNCNHNNTKGLCCLHNPENCKYRQLQKENAELKEKISVLLSCKNCPENKGGLICQKEYENKCLAQKIEFIKELQKENAELKTDYEVLSCSVGNFGELQNKLEEEQRKNNGLEEQLTNAKEIISEYVRLANLEKEDTVAIWQLYHKAEQFLNSEVKNSSCQGNFDN